MEGSGKQWRDETRRGWERRKVGRRGEEKRRREGRGGERQGKKIAKRNCLGIISLTRFRERRLRLKRRTGVGVIVLMFQPPTIGVTVVAHSN